MQNTTTYTAEQLITAQRLLTVFSGMETLTLLYLRDGHPADLAAIVERAERMRNFVRELPGELAAELIANISIDGSSVDNACDILTEHRKNAAK